MERLPRRAPAAGGGPIVAQLADHQLAHRVVEVGRIIGAARCLLIGGAFVLEAFFHEQLLRISHAHPACMQPDGGNEPAIAQQGVGQLADVRLGIAIAEPRFPHHFLGVMRPALGIGITNEEPSEHRRAAVGVEEVEEVPGHHFMDRREQQVALTGDIGGLLFRRPCRVWRGDVIDRGHALLERSRRIDIGAVLPVIGRTFAHQRLFGAGERDEVLLLDEGGQRRDLADCRGNRAAGALVGVHLGHAFRHRAARCGFGAFGLQRVLIALEVGAANGLQLVERNVDAFVGEHHLGELVRPQREVLCGRGFLPLQPITQVGHRL